MVAPWQLLPPHRGAGLSHDLERHKQELTPSAPPSSLLQGCHDDHRPKPPLAVWLRSWGPEGGPVKIGEVMQGKPCRGHRTGQAVMFCFHWLMLELSSSVVQRCCLKSQPQ